MSTNQWVEREFVMPELALSEGGSLKQARVKYLQKGRLNAQKNNMVVLPTYYGGAMAGTVPLAEGGSPLNSGAYCIIVPALLGNGESSSPSNTLGEHAGPGFPTVSIYDNVMAQKALLEAEFGDPRIALVAGWSMGGMQAFQWGALFPHQVNAILPICATAKCYPHTWLFFEGVKSALACDPAFADGHYSSPPERGIRAFARVYAGWAYSSAFFNKQLYRALGFASIDELLTFWEDDHLAWDANDLMALIRTVQCADISANSRFNHDLGKALKTITCKVTVMPSRTDQFLPADEAQDNAKMMPNAQFRMLETQWGHCGGGPGREPEAMAQVFDAMAELL